MSNPPPLDAAARDELARKVDVTRLEGVAKDALVARREKERCVNEHRFDEAAMYRGIEVGAERSLRELATADVILALLAAAERGAEDTARIDWLSEDCAQNCQFIDMVDGEWKATSYNGAGEIETTHDTMRDAIDEAMAGQARFRAARSATPTEGDDHA